MIIFLRESFFLSLRSSSGVNREPRDKSAAAKDGLAKSVKMTATYPTLADAIENHTWAGMTRRQTKELNPAIPFTVLGRRILLRSPTNVTSSDLHS